MSGHSKWSSIKHKKEKADAARGRLFTKLIREITIASRLGGGNEEANPRLRTAILAAKAANMPMENITRAIKKGTGELEGQTYEDVTYEAYGPDGVAILLECVTDNKKRCVSEIRHVLAKHAGKMAEPGSVAWMFKTAARVVVEAEKVNEEELLTTVLEAGADDLDNQGDCFEITSPPEALESIKEACEKAGYTVRESKQVKIPSSTVPVEGKAAGTLLKLLEALEELDDVQNVWANFEMDDALLESLA